MTSSTHFTLVKKSSKSAARAGILHTPHGDIETPVFMPVGTQATVKGLLPDNLLECGAQVVLSNTYHLSLRPGVEVIKHFGGLHRFMNWNKPILTDSGGFQVFSLSKIRKIVPEGVIFNSHIDGSKHLFTPESVVDLQLGFNSDILMPLDICSPHPTTFDSAQKDVNQTLIWARQAKDHWEKHHTGQMLYAIVQGGMYEPLRESCAKALVDMDFPGYAIGGVSVGEPTDLLEAQMRFTTPLLPEHKPRYVMGVGLPENMDVGIRCGVDMFDCVIPTRLARHAQAFTSSGKLNIRNAAFTYDESPLDSTCGCQVCTQYSRAYLRHLFMAKEMLGMLLMSIHNVHFLINHVKSLRKGILNGTV
jgi:queuine tRNA-ribosyltransferase